MKRHLLAAANALLAGLLSLACLHHGWLEVALAPASAVASYVLVIRHYTRPAIERGPR
jgi:hypothetical protein